MSRLYFHARHRTAEVGGSEQAYLGWFARHITESVLALDASHDIDMIREVTVNPPPHVAKLLNAPMPDVMADLEAYREWAQWPQWWHTSMSAGPGRVRINGKEIWYNEMCLNTLIAMGSPQLTVMAHLAGLNSSHIYVEAENAEWFADVLHQGRQWNVYRPDQGWEDVIVLCHEVAAGLPGPIVTSYSVDESFPNRELSSYQSPVCVPCKGTGEPNPDMKYTDVDYDYCTSCGGDGRLYDSWYDLSDEEKWDMAVQGLRERDWPFAMGPDKWNQGFLTGASAFDLKAEHWVGQLSPVHEK